MKVGIHASHEQFSPAELLDVVVAAEAAGFEAMMCSDHLAPWSERQGSSGHGPTWLSAALQRTSLDGGIVCAPGPRNHPVVLAQVLATIADMSPGRAWVALGSGEAFNEAMLGEPWPSKATRMGRLREAVDVMRALWRGETIGECTHFSIADARLWTVPASAPLILAAALGEATAAWAAEWADGLITVAAEDEQLRRILAAWRDAGGTGPVYLQAQVAWADTDEAALAAAHDQWRNAAFSPALIQDAPSVSVLDAAGALVRPDDVAAAVRVSSDPARHAAWLASDAELGFDRVFVHHVGRNQREFIRVFGTDVLPRLH